MKNQVKLNNGKLHWVLAIPSWSFRETHLTSMHNSVTGAWPPMGIMCVGAAVKRAGATVKLLDGLFYTSDQLLKEIYNEQPQVVGISCVSLMWPKARKLIKQVKEMLPETYLLVGGHAPSAFRDKCLTECAELDAVVVGDGEYVAEELTKQFYQGNKYPRIPGLICRTSEGIINGGEPKLLDLDETSLPGRDLLNLKKYTPAVGQYKRLPIFAVESSRGCENKCINCSKICGQNTRYKSPTRVLHEIDILINQYGAKEISFTDEHFTAKRERALEICQSIIDRKYDIVWTATSRVDEVDKELLHLMKAAGCWHLQIGAESGVQKHLDFMQKNITLEQTRQAVKWAHEAGMQVTALYMLGLPNETYADGLETISFAISLNTFYIEFFPLVPFPGTAMHEIACQYGEFDPQLARAGMHLMPFVPHTMTRKELVKLRRLAFLKYCLRWKFIKMRLLNLRSWLEVKILLKGIQMLVKLWGENIINWFTTAKRKNETS